METDGDDAGCGAKAGIVTVENVVGREANRLKDEDRTDNSELERAVDGVNEKWFDGVVNAAKGVLLGASASVVCGGHDGVEGPRNVFPLEMTAS